MYCKKKTLGVFCRFFFKIFMIVHIYCINFICTFPIIWNFFLQYYTSVNMNFKIKTKLAKSCITEYNCYQFLIFIDKTLKFFLHKLTNFSFFLINSVSYIVLWNYPEVKLYSINLIQYLISYLWIVLQEIGQTWCWRWFN